MSEIAKRARAAMKAKANKLADRPTEKVDSSDWTPPPLLKADVKTGMRPVSRRAFKKGGKVIGKVEGQVSKARADRKARKSGGSAEQPIVDRYINRDLKKANEYRDGYKHIGALKRGGRAKLLKGGDPLAGLSDEQKEMVKKGIDPFQDERPSTMVIKKTTAVVPAKGAKVPLPPRRPADLMNKGGRAKKQMGGPMMDPRLSMVKDKTFEFGQNVVTPGLKRGGKAGHPDVAQDKALIKKMVKGKALRDEKCYGGRTKKQTGGGVFSGPGYPGKVPGVVPGGRDAHAKGGRTKGKGKSNINITINAGPRGQQDQQAMMGGMPQGMPPAPPQGMPPMPPMGAGGPPMGPAGAPPMPGAFKKGGRVGKAIGGAFASGKSASGAPQMMRSAVMPKDFAGPLPRGGGFSGGPTPIGGGSSNIDLGSTPAIRGGGMGRPIGGGIAPQPAQLGQNPAVRNPPALGQLPVGNGLTPVQDYAAPPVRGGGFTGFPPGFRGTPIDPVGPRVAGEVTLPGGGAIGGGPTRIGGPLTPMPGGGGPAPRMIPGPNDFGMGSVMPMPGAPGQLNNGTISGMPNQFGAPGQLRAFKSGGRVSKVAKSYKDMEAGAGSGEGRLQKTDIAKRSMRKDGGKVGHRTYRSYKDMDAGSGSGLGRLEKTEIESKKR